MTEAISASCSCLQPLCECLDGTGMLDRAAREVNSFLRLKSNWSDLNKAKNLLHAVEKAVRVEVSKELNKLNLCDSQVEVWLRRVCELRLDDIDEDYRQLMRYHCLSQCTIHAHRRASIGQRVVEALDEVVILMEERKRFKVFGFKPPWKIDGPLPQIKTFGLAAMLSELQLRNLFEKGDSNIIGVWGPGGVGKTTLLHNFNNYLEKKKKAHNYQVVIMIEVSYSAGTLNIAAIQRTITYHLDWPWNDSVTEETRARDLAKALRCQKFIILLDDVRNKFRLEDIGIPTPDSESKSKLIFTSREEDVCYQMGARQSLIKMKYLRREWAWELFRRNLGPDALAAIDSPDPSNLVWQHAEAIVQSCGGLPLALKVIGRAVAGLAEPSDWSFAVQATKDDIKDFNGVPGMFHKLKYSYDKLTEIQQQCFLYCTLLPEYGSISKDYLVDCWMEVGLIPKDPEQGHRIIRSLLSAYLLENCKSDFSEVKMHHLIRYPGISLAGQENARHKLLREWKFMPSLGVREFFNGSNMGMMGVRGPGGVGKTTLINTFNNELKEWSTNYQMDHEVDTRRNSLERMLLDESAEPTDLPLSLLEDITNCFSNDRQIGIGGFAVVYKGMVGNGMVAVKKLSRTFDMHENKFHKEVECLMKAKHKNIVRFLGYCSEARGKIADYEGKFVMADVRNWLLCFEYVPRGSLDKHITDASRGLAWKERFQIIKGICDGLCHLHKNRILHLDLKPANILVDDHMVPKITDFGISRFLDAEQTRVVTSNVCGSIGYLAPEIYKGQIAFASDIYSLGVIILEILTGKKEYSEVENVTESWMNRLEASYEGEVQMKQVRVCTTIGIKCMDSDPKRRPVMRHIVDMLDKVAGLDYLDETDIHSSSDDLHASFLSEQYRE